MKKTLSFDPKTFQPGINYILVEMIEKKTVKVMVVCIKVVKMTMNTTDV
jgi:hypothetical protein